ncbi:MAG: uroporphyrinogen-III C-methyltransferase [Eubacterium sp.]|nr:uroporphyrinogen-III C-methyltransferase [Eubacterium sp.]
MEKKSKGICYIAGAGPGDPGLVTVKTKKLIGEADVIVYDDLIGTELLHEKREDAELIYVGKRAGKHNASQEDINSILVEKTKEGLKVLRLKGGDPFVFGRGSEECAALKNAGLNFTVIPGITSAISVPMYAGIPVTERGVSRSVTIITGHKKHKDVEDDYSRYAAVGGTLVFLMGLGNIELIIEGLRKGGLDTATPVAVISQGTTEDQYVLRGTASNICKRVRGDSKVVTPAIIVVGELAARKYLSEELTSVELSTSGKPSVIYVTGTKDFVEKEVREFAESGIKATPWPHITIETVNEARLDEEIDRLEEYTHIAFLSQHSIRIFMNAFLRRNDIRRLSSVKLATVGKASADFFRSEYNISVDIIPKEYNSEAMSLEISKDIRSEQEQSSKEGRLLIVRAKEGDRSNNHVFDSEGISYTDLSIYQLSPDKNVAEIVKHSAEEISLAEKCFITFGSAEGVRLFAETGINLGDSVKVVCIGKYTADAAKKHFRNEVITVENSSIKSMVEEVSKRL